MTAATVSMDPRIRARRTAVMREAGRRRLRMLVVVLSLAALAAGGWAVTRSPVLDIDHVQVRGVEGARADEVAAAAGVATGTPLLDVDAGAVEARLEALPWVEEAHVVRDWPGALSMAVVPRTPVAAVPSGSGVALLDANGYVIDRRSRPAAAADSPLPLIDTPLAVAVGDVHLEAAPGLAVVAALTPDLAPWVESVTVDGDIVGLRLVGGATVDMGPAVRLDDKVTAVRAVLAGVELACMAEIDVTVADQTSVRRTAACLSVLEATESDS